MSKLKQGDSEKQQYAAYKTNGRYAKNKAKKLERHLRKFPEDAQAKAALDNISSTPKRKTPNSEVWTAPRIEMAEIYASLGINGLHALGNHRISASTGDLEHLRYFDTQPKRGNKNSKKNEESELSY